MIKFGLRLLGILSTIREWAAKIISGVFLFAKNHPWQFAVVMLIGLSTIMYMRAENFANKLVRAEARIVEAQNRLDLFEAALEFEKDSHRKTIQSHNQEVENLRIAGEQARARAQAEAALRRGEILRYEDLARRFGQANASTGTAEERIAREEATNEEFIQEFWRSE